MRRPEVGDRDGLDACASEGGVRMCLMILTSKVCNGSILGASASWKTGMPSWGDR